MRRLTGCVAQVRAGTGGEEAALWAADLVRMYSKYADAQGWRTAHIAESQAESGGVKEAILQARLPAWVPSYPMPCAAAGSNSRVEVCRPGYSVCLTCCC